MTVAELLAKIAALEEHVVQDGKERSVGLEPPVVWPEYWNTFPGGYSLPPPPPGIAPPEFAGAYVVDRPWGQLWFTFYTGDRLVSVALAPGRKGSPGV